MLKRILLSIIIVLALIISVPVIYIYQLDSEQLKKSVSNLLSSKTQHQFKFKGDLHWQVLPNIRIVVNDVSIKPQKQGNSIQGRIGQLALRLNTWDLLFRKLNVRDILLKDADLIADISTTRQIQSNPKSNNKQSQSKKKSLDISLKKVTVQNSSIIVKNNKNNYAFKISSFQMKERGDTQVFRLHSDIRIENDGQIFIGNNILFSGKTSHVDTLASQSPVLKEISMDATLKGKTIRINDLNMENFETDLNFNNGLLHAKKYMLTIADGQVMGHLHYDLNQDALVIDQKISNIDTKALIDALKSKVQIASGKLNLEWQSKTHPVNKNALYNTRATGKLTYDNTFINLPKTLETLEAMVQTLPRLIGQSQNSLQNKFKLSLSPKIDDKNYQKFYKGSLIASFKMNHGLINPIQFDLTHPKLKASGQIKVNIKNQNVDGNMKLVTFSIDKNIQKAQALLKGSFPLIIKGNLSDIKAYPDMAVITPLLINQFVKEQSQDAIKKWGNRLINKALSNLDD